MSNLFNTLNNFGSFLSNGSNQSTTSPPPRPPSSIDRSGSTISTDPYFRVGTNTIATTAFPRATSIDQSCSTISTDPWNLRVRANTSAATAFPHPSIHRSIDRSGSTITTYPYAPRNFQAGSRTTATAPLLQQSINRRHLHASATYPPPPNPPNHYSYPPQPQPYQSSTITRPVPVSNQASASSATSFTHHPGQLTSISHHQQTTPISCNQEAGQPWSTLVQPVQYHHLTSPPPTTQYVYSRPQPPFVHQSQVGTIPLSSAIAQDLGDQFSSTIKGAKLDRHSFGHTTSRVKRSKKRKNHSTSIGFPSNFHPQPSAVPETKFKVLCLASKNRTTTLSKEERDEHARAGLGPKDISFRRDGDYDHFCSRLQEEFPQLGPKEGFLLFKAASGGNGIHNLNLIPTSQVGYTPSYLRTDQNVQRSTTLYYRPLQRDLPLTPLPCATFDVPINCVNCSRPMKVEDFPDHFKVCSEECPMETFDLLMDGPAATIPIPTCSSNTITSSSSRSSIVLPSSAAPQQETQPLQYDWSHILNDPSMLSGGVDSAQETPVFDSTDSDNDLPLPPAMQYRSNQVVTSPHVTIRSRSPPPVDVISPQRVTPMAQLNDHSYASDSIASGRNPSCNHSHPIEQDGLCIVCIQDRDRRVSEESDRRRDEERALEQQAAERAQAEEDLTELFEEDEPINPPTTEGLREQRTSYFQSRLSTTVSTSTFSTAATAATTSTTTLSTAAAVVNLNEHIIHRSNLVAEMFQLFSSDNILEGTIPNIRLVETNGSVEAGVGVGLLREALTSFFDEISFTHMNGTVEKVPRLRLDMSRARWEAIGRMISCGMKFCDYFPLYLSPVFILYGLFGENSYTDADLCKSYMRFVSECDKEMINAAKKDSSVFKDGVFIDFICNSGGLSVPSNERELEKTLSEMAHFHMVQQPSYVAGCFKDVWVRTDVPPQFIDAESTLKYFESLVPTQYKVIRCLKLENNTPNSAEQKVFGFLERFLRGCDYKILLLFLKFVTGCDVMPEALYVTVQELNVRAPIGRTCGNTLQLDSRYDNFEQFTQEFKNILLSKEAFEFSII